MEKIDSRIYEIAAVIDLPCFDIEVIRSNLEEDEGHFQRYAFILHDRDFHQDGSAKKPHYHLYAYCSSRPRKKEWLNLLTQWFGCNTVDQVSVRKCSSTESTIQYLIHKNEDADKAIYDEGSIVTNIPKDTFSVYMNTPISESFSPTFEYLMKLYKDCKFDDMAFLCRLGVERYVRYRAAIDKVIYSMREQKVQLIRSHRYQQDTLDY